MNDPKFDEILIEEIRQTLPEYIRHTVKEQHLRAIEGFEGAVNAMKAVYTDGLNQNQFVESVKEFHYKFEIPEPLFPAIPEFRRCLLRRRLIEEETRELINAIYNKDIVKIADGIADSIYVILGTALEFGMGDIIRDVFNEVHRSNMSKLDADGKPVKREDGKVIKSELYTAPDIEPIIVAAIPAF